MSVNECLTDFVRHDVLTFGAVLHRRKPGILGHFPSIPCPPWYYSRSNSDVDVEYSQSVPSLLHLTFKNKTDVQINIKFSLELSLEVRQQYWTSYITQSFLFHDNQDNSEDLVFVDEVGFTLIGTFASSPSSLHPPKYLHVSLPHPRNVNGSSGETKIAEADWESYEIPNLRVETHLGSRSNVFSHHTVWEYFEVKNLLDGGRFDNERFATAHEYPVVWIVEGTVLMLARIQSRGSIRVREQYCDTYTVVSKAFDGTG
ncbi:hypothetical protein L218DRAFT_736201 [Marasmius fiardii PR-910]|nr:hypothetical protein L218DRAFT_736201 [Marasmius fiardii PR-910]